MNYSFHRGAQQDPALAVDFYQTHAAPAVAVRFINELDRVVPLLMVHPDFGTPTSEGRRTYPLKGFPYSVIYKARGSHLKITVVRHQNRKFEHGRDRH